MNLNQGYNKFIKYYKDNWLYNPYINYMEISNDEYLNRTNNLLERYHGILNQQLEFSHPKL